MINFLGWLLAWAANCIQMARHAERYPTHSAGNRM